MISVYLQLGNEILLFHVCPFGICYWFSNRIEFLFDDKLFEISRDDRKLDHLWIAQRLQMYRRYLNSMVITRSNIKHQTKLDLLFTI